MEALTQVPIPAWLEGTAVLMLIGFLSLVIMTQRKDLKEERQGRAQDHAEVVGVLRDNNRVMAVIESKLK